MCGLFGAAGPSLSKKDQEAVKVLGNLSVVRGRDSTGLATCFRPTSMRNGGFKFKVHKALQEAPVFMGSKPIEKIMADSPFAISGHVRFATHGTVKLSNAHPFTCGHYIGMHNGVIGSLFDRENDRTDSEVLFREMMKSGVEPGIKYGLKNGGDMALVFFNKSNGSLNYYRNNGRPLFIGVEEKKKKFFWASEKDFLEFLQKHNLERFSQIYSVAPFMLHTINLKNMKIDTQEIKGETRVYYSRRDYSWDPAYSRTSVPVVTPVGSKPARKDADDSYTGCGIGLGCYSRKIEEVKSIGSRPAVVVGPLKPREYSAPEVSKSKATYFRGFANELLDVGKAAQLVIGKDAHCDCCGHHHTTLATKVWWFSKKTYLCDECHSDEAVMELAYDGYKFYSGMLVDQDNFPKIKAHQLEEDVPF